MKISKQVLTAWRVSENKRYNEQFGLSNIQNICKRTIYLLLDIAVHNLFIMRLGFPAKKRETIQRRNSISTLTAHYYIKN